MCSRIGVTVFGICADAPARAGPESASNTVTRIREDYIFDFLLVQNSWRAPSMNVSVCGMASELALAQCFARRFLTNPETINAVTADISD